MSLYKKKEKAVGLLLSGKDPQLLHKKET